MNILEEKIDELKTVIEGSEVDALERMAQYRVSDAIRESATVNDQASTWIDGQGNLCALSSAFVAARARGYMA